jgi:hypothetical protein
VLVPGNPFSLDDYTVREGWNMYGFPWARPLLSHALIEGPFWYWDASRMRYQMATELLPGYAYWFRAVDDGVLAR